MQHSYEQRLSNYGKTMYEVLKAEDKVLHAACQWYEDCNTYGCMQDTENLYYAIGEYIKLVKEKL